MNNLMTGLYVGKSLAEGDYLGAMPFLTDIINAVKTAAPNLLKDLASQKLALVQKKLAVQAPPMPAAEAQPYAPPAPPPNPWPRYIAYAALAGGVIYVVRRMKRRR